MEAASPARLYAAAIGALLLVVGIFGFFYSASFGSPGEVEDGLGVLEVNGWLNLLHVATGAVGLLAASYAARPFALAFGLFYTLLAIWGFTLGAGDAILGFLPASSGNDVLHLVIGLLGLAAAAGTPRTASSSRGSFRNSGVKKEPRDRKRGLKARADAAGEGA
ncbi:MAG TPA: DUF4383 domain-containing protein [Solirubrobacterales bacterium]|jgi:hypothetical protein|nr:DUF4383 domain-containing protein [Solirubrobacterales bacterium]